MLRYLICPAVPLLTLWSVVYLARHIRRQLRGQCGSCGGACGACAGCGRRKD